MERRQGTGKTGEGNVEAIRAQIRAEALAEEVELVGALGPDEVVSWYRRAAAHVNATRTGSGDKAALEAMSCGCPSLAANEGFREILGDRAAALVFRQGDAADLAEKLAGVLALSSDEREAMGRELRARIVRDHGLLGLADRLTVVLREVAASARPRRRP